MRRRNRSRIARNTHNRNVSSSIPDKFPVAGVISDVSTPRKYPAHVVRCCYARTSMRGRGYIRNYTAGPLSFANTGGPVHGRERNLLIHGRSPGNSGFSFPARYSLTVCRLRASAKAFARNRFYLPSPQGNRDARTVSVAYNAAICQAV